MGLILHSLGFLVSFTSSLPLVILVGLLAIIPGILVCWACFTIFLFYFLHIVELLLLLGHLSKVGINKVFLNKLEGRGGVKVFLGGLYLFAIYAAEKI